MNDETIKNLFGAVFPEGLAQSEQNILTEREKQLVHLAKLEDELQRLRKRVYKLRRDLGV